MGGLARRPGTEGLRDWGDCLGAALGHLAEGLSPRPKGGPELILRSGPSSSPYSPKCVEQEFSEVCAIRCLVQSPTRLAVPCSSNPDVTVLGSVWTNVNMLP